ncbi:hypothetical protein V5799_006903 [Amblyomma americanum]|uniref:3',5'-cyclic-AMP phosphodiesterase n=1 Tax=Amblyomma americanum TaxID=6943 RepID=A0AAQ4DV25_AMBAM
MPSSYEELAEREEAAIIPLITSGYNRWFLESCSPGVCLNEMVQIEHNDLINLWKLMASEALFSALQSARDGIIVTGPKHEIQFMNSAAERLVGYTVEEMLGMDAQELHRKDSLNADVAGSISTQLESGKEWKGTLFHKRKSGECVPVVSKIAPVDINITGPLIWLGMSLFTKLDVRASLECDDATMRNWLQLVESHYLDNPYHNSTHAGDVMQATAYFLLKLRKKEIFDPLDETICLISAVVHDIDHPGRSSPFLCNSDHELAILYNDRSVLESHHAAFAFKLTLSDEKANIFHKLERDVYRTVRSSIIDMVLATEMTKHFEHLSKFLNVFQRPAQGDDGSNPEVFACSCGAERENVNAKTGDSER